MRKRLNNGVVERTDGPTAELTYRLSDGVTEMLKLIDNHEARF
jgi:hypothetical protein